MISRRASRSARSSPSARSSTRIYAPLTSLTNARVDLMTSLVCFERVFEVLDAPDRDQRPARRRRPGRPAGRIELDDVCVPLPAGGRGRRSRRSSRRRRAAAPTTPTATGAARASASRSTPGETVALVGPSGAGKTTLASLVPRLYDVTDGRRARRRPRRPRPHPATRCARPSASSTQDPHLFHESIGDNLRYARPDATDDELAAACRAARIHDIIAALPDGYDTVVGERGYRLSGGEKQRLAIARMLLKDPAIVILDEATSHLDNENEAAVQAPSTTALDGRTAIVIAHRLSTIVDADRIAGARRRAHRRAGHATTSSLAAGGLYADLYRTLVRAQPV